MGDERIEELELPELVLGAAYLAGLLTLIGWLAG